MSIRDDSTREEFKYEPASEVPKSDSNIVDVWSPDEEYLVLLRGNFKGFYIIKAIDVPGERIHFFGGENIKGKIEPVADTQSDKRLQRTRHEQASLLSCVGEPLKRGVGLLTW
jgi:hypothetical protein